MLAVAFACATGFLFTAPLSPRTAVPRRASICMEESEYERYIREKRSEADMAATDAMYKQFKGIDQEFDGGDSGGGAVSDSLLFAAWPPHTPARCIPTPSLLSGARRSVMATWIWRTSTTQRRWARFAGVSPI